ncbi:MAG: hypothetical protein JW941_08980 [Candidatus Coatesbacteria bacterium]|nr:hypothetical protein [Candidatus Coatesbacteria bacterium]
MSNLVKAAKARDTYCVNFDFESFIVSLNNGIEDMKTSDIEKFEPELVHVSSESNQRAADELIQAAEKRASEIVNDAQARASKMLNEAKAQGIKLGKDEGSRHAREEALSVARQEVAATVAAMQRAAQELSKVREKVLNESDTEMLSLVLGVTRLILSREIKTDKTLILEQIRRAARILGEADEIVVKLHPLDLKTAQNSVDSLIPDGKSMRISLIADKSIEQGGCMVECDRGSVDARISTQLGRIEAAFNEVMSSAGEEAPKPKANGEDNDV